MTLDVRSGYCRRCARDVLVQRDVPRASTSCCLDAFLLIVTCGLWFIPAALLALARFAPYRCSLCGSVATRYFLR